jgi:hypothetical protein
LNYPASVVTDHLKEADRGAITLRNPVPRIKHQPARKYRHIKKYLQVLGSALFLNNYDNHDICILVQSLAKYGNEQKNSAKKLP